MNSIQESEKQHSAVISYDTGFHCGVLGCSISGQRCSAAITFYTQTLGFNLDMQNLPAFGQVSIGGLKLILTRSWGHLGRDQCAMAVNKSPADGTVCSFRSRICLRALRS